mmetsp:Transcript_36565/g.66294  ORF Transcript_36565/g.66294 Transcript_36565/m.66294 type:complete len:174 (+) Transcript_36565:38-559(+)
MVDAIVYAVEPGASKVRFKIGHKGSAMTCEFTKFSGAIHIDPNSESSVAALMDGSYFNVASSSLESGLGSTADGIATWNMDSTKYPTFTCKLNPVAADIAAEDRTGLVTIRDVTKEEVFTVHLDSDFKAGQEQLKMQVTATIKRLDYGVNPMWPTMMLGDEIRLEADLVAILL